MPDFMSKIHQSAKFDFRRGSLEHSADPIARFKGAFFIPLTVHL